MRKECLEINDYTSALRARLIIGDWRHADNPLWGDPRSPVNEPIDRRESQIRHCVLRRDSK